MLLSPFSGGFSASNETADIPSEIQAYLDIDWRAEYPELMDIYFETDTCSPWGMPMYFIDIDMDGTYELLAKIGSYSKGCDKLFVYDCSDGKAVYKGCINGGYSAADNEHPNNYCNKNTADIYYDEEKNICGIFTSVNYALGGLYGYDFYFSTADASGIYHSEPIGSVYAPSRDYSPPYEWNYTLSDNRAESADEKSFRKNLNGALSGVRLEQKVTEVFLDTGGFADGVSDEEYSDMILSLKKEIRSKLINDLNG